MNNRIIYLTYQTFPANTANTIQTIDNAKYIRRKGYEVEIVFPLRSKLSTDELNKIKKHYEFDDDIKFKGIKHNLPFGRYKTFEKYLYLLSHFVWSKKITKKYQKNIFDNSVFLTRSDWIFYFLSKKGFNVTFECHQLTRIRKWIIQKSISNKRSKIIFLNRNLLNDSGVDNQDHEKFIVLQNGVDSNLFSNKNNSKKFEIIFTGNIQRFNDDRGLKFIIRSFLNEEIPNNLKLKIIGWPLKEVEELRGFVNSLNLNHCVEILNRLDRKLTIAQIEKSSIGLLINSSNNLHSYKHTSPLKYFEYLYGELNILAVDFPSHKSLPFSDNITFFNENDEQGFLKALLEINKKKIIPRNELNDITLQKRVDKLLTFITK
tara:strand:- start:42 stop:1166 length:1125 start_codon:yes stop_codon:yes gene_type:complete